MSLQDVKIILKDKEFTTSAYCKPTFNGIYANVGSFLRSPYKSGTVYTLARRCFWINSGWTKH